MPLQNIKINKAEDKEWTIIPEDVYPCVVEDLTEVEGKKYQSEELQTKIQIKLKVVGGEYDGSILIKRVTPTISTGYEGGKPSGLYVFLRACFPELDFEDLQLEGVNAAIGRNVRAMVKTKTSGQGKEYNVIADFMKAKEQEVKPEAEEKPPLPF